MLTWVQRVIISLLADHCCMTDHPKIQWLKIIKIDFIALVYSPAEVQLLWAILSQAACLLPKSENQLKQLCSQNLSFSLDYRLTKAWFSMAAPKEQESGQKHMDLFKTQAYSQHTVTYNIFTCYWSKQVTCQVQNQGAGKYTPPARKQQQLYIHMEGQSIGLKVINPYTI